MAQIHQEIMVELKSTLTQGLRQEISMLIIRRYMNDHNIPVKKQLSQMMVTHVDMICFDFVFVMVFCANCTAPWSSSKTFTQNMSTYSASVVAWQA